MAFPHFNGLSLSQVATQEVTRDDQQVEMVKTVSSLVVVVQPVAGRSSGPLSVQPSIMAVDTAVRQTLPDFFKNTETAVFRQLLENCTWYRTGRASLCVCFQGECVSVGVTTLTISTVLKDANGNPAEGLQGNTTIPFSGCWANYTDLAIFTSGGSPLLHKIIFLGLLSVVILSVYSNCPPCISFTGENLKLAFTLNEWKAESRSFTLRAATTPSSLVVTTEDDNFPSIFGSCPAVLSQSAYLLMLWSGLLLLLMRP